MPSPEFRPPLSLTCCTRRRRSDISGFRVLDLLLTWGPCSCAAGRQPAAPGSEGEDEEAAAAALGPFPRITRAATEALRYRAEDIARSLTKTVIKEVSQLPIPDIVCCALNASVVRRSATRGAWILSSIGFDLALGIQEVN